MKCFQLEPPENRHGFSVSKQLNDIGAQFNDSTVHRFDKQVWSDLFVAHAAEHYRYVGEDHFEEYGEGSCDLCDHDIRTICYAELKEGADPFSHYDPELDLRITWPSELRLGSTCINLCGLSCDNRSFVMSCFAPGKCPSFRLDSDDKCPLDILCDHRLDWVNERLAAPLSIFSIDKHRWDRWVGKGYWLMRNPFVPRHRGQRLLYRSCKSESGLYRGIKHFDWWQDAVSLPENQLYVVLNQSRAEHYSDKD